MVVANSFTLRDWFGMVTGMCWGLILSRFFASDDMTGPWLVILFGPPVVLLISSARPILSWQLPIVTAVVAGILIHRAPEDSAGLALLEAALIWLMCSFFSSPWALIFLYRARRRGEQQKSKGPAAAYVGVGLLLFLSCALTLLGFAATVYPVTLSGPPNRSFPMYGFLMATAGIGLGAVSSRMAKKLEVPTPVRAILEVIMIPGVLLGVAGIVDHFRWLDTSGSPSGDGGISCILVGLEALGAMIWMTVADRRSRATLR